MGREAHFGFPIACNSKKLALFCRYNVISMCTFVLIGPLIINLVIIIDILNRIKLISYNYKLLETRTELPYPFARGLIRADKFRAIDLLSHKNNGTVGSSSCSDMSNTLSKITDGVSCLYYLDITA